LLPWFRNSFKPGEYSNSRESERGIVDCDTDPETQIYASRKDEGEKVSTGEKNCRTGIERKAVENENGEKAVIFPIFGEITKARQREGRKIQVEQTEW